MGDDRTPVSVVPLIGAQMSQFARRRFRSIPTFCPGRAKNASTQVTETRMKSAVKVPAKKTNNLRESFGKSILKNNMEMEAAMELALHADRSGKRTPKNVHTVQTIVQKFEQMCLVCTEHLMVYT